MPKLCKTRNLAIANTSRASCATSRPSIVTLGNLG